MIRTAKRYLPHRGRIEVDGVDLADLVTTGWRARTSAAFQDFGRFHIHFTDTIGIGDLAHLHHTGRITDAIHAADAQPLLDRLPDGLDTQLGRQFDGVELSEGQWQCTALARASMRTDPLLFVLDEPTASLDAPSEHHIFQRYLVRARELASRTGAITIIVSHRFTTVTGADHILVLHRGRLVEQGTHHELLAADGRYATLYNIQATAYTHHSNTPDRRLPSTAVGMPGSEGCSGRHPPRTAMMALQWTRSTHTDVEDALSEADTTHKKMTLAVFDDPRRGGDLLPRLNTLGWRAAATLQACRAGAHRVIPVICARSWPTRSG